MKLICLAVLLLISSAISAQELPVTSKPIRPEAPATPALENKNRSVLIEVNEDYKIGSGDVLEIQIEDAPELSHQYRVNATGTIQMPVVGKLNCAAQTAESLAQQIERALKENEYLKHPNVTVTIKQYNSQTFFIHGEVRQPGVYQVEGQPSILKLLSLAGGLTDKHGTTIFLLHPENSQANATTKKITDDAETSADFAMQRINLSALLQGETRQNLRVAAGTILYIPASDIYFVGGEVIAPGSFQLKEGATLRQAIALAKGMTPKAVPSKAIIFRANHDTEQRLEIKANVNEIMNGKQPDIALQANDVIVLPSSRTKSITSGFMNAVPSAAAVALGQLPYIFLR